jgi:hypothetical protein
MAQIAITPADIRFMRADLLRVHRRPGRVTLRRPLADRHMLVMGRYGRDDDLPPPAAPAAMRRAM